MNAMTATLANVYPLPSVLDGRLSSTAPARRHRIGDFDLDDRRIDHFNSLLLRLDRARQILAPDQLVSAARAVVAAAGGGRAPAAIRQRMRRAAAVGLMAGDRQWRSSDEAGEHAGLVMDYVRSRSDLIPDALPAIGRLDDAIVVDTAWPQLAPELDDYLDYRRLRRIEAGLRGRDIQRFGFSREDWQDARLAEAALLRHCREVGRRSYVPAPAMPTFRVC